MGHLNATSTRVRRFRADGSIEARRKSMSAGNKFRDFKRLRPNLLISLRAPDQGGVGS